MFKSSTEDRRSIFRASLLTLHHFEPAVPRYSTNVMARGTRAKFQSEDTERVDHCEDAGVCEMCGSFPNHCRMRVINEIA